MNLSNIQRRSSPSLLAVVLVGVFSACGGHTAATKTTAARPETARLHTAAPMLPYKLEVLEVAPSALPALHSFSTAVVGGQWLLIGGRTSGLHGFGGGNNFPRSGANTLAYVIDPSANQVVGSRDLVQDLPATLAGPLTATNAQSIQVGSDLYIVGGYGQDLSSGSMTTFGSLIKVDAAGLIQAIVAKQPIAGFFRSIPSPDDRLKVTGGDLKVSGGVFYLVFGQDFTGNYSIENHDYNRAGGQFQKYTEKVRVFTLNSDLSIDAFRQIDGGYDADLPYNRRDLNVVDTILPDGVTQDAMIYGGVFRAGQVAGHLMPIQLGLSSTMSGATVSNQPQFSQALNHYDCGNLTIFDASSGTSFTTLFGGISQYHYDSSTKTLVLDALDLPAGIDGLPFVNTISTIARAPANAGFTFSQTIQPVVLTGLLGTEAQFHPSRQLSATQLRSNGVIDLAGITQRTLVGHVYGGIESFGPYSTYGSPPPGTQATGRLFQVYVTPVATPVVPMPPLPAQATPYVPPTEESAP